ncbi:MAG: histidine kinase N-terminal 7TM domain-containing protein [Chloroflexota bacterium]
MSQGYAYTPQIWPSVFTTFLLVVLCAYSVRRRSVPGALPFSVACLFGILWAAGSVMEEAATDVGLKIFWVKFQTVWHLPAGTAVTCFLLEYARPGRWLTRRNLALLSIPSLAVLLSVSTNHLHHLVWRGFRFDGTVVPLPGPIEWAIVAGIYALALVNFIILGWLFVRSPQHRWPVAIIIAGQIGARVLYTLEATSVVRTAVPLDVIALASLFVVYTVALFGFAMFDPIPLARRTVISQMRDGVLVLDSKDRIVSLNPAAERILAMPIRRAQGHSLHDLLPACAELDGESEIPRTKQAEISLGRGPESRAYALAISPLKDWRELEVGRLLLLRDVTDRRRAQEQVLQQQWAEATLQERELLAQELHDGLAQNLGFLNLQAQAAQVYLREGHPEAAQETLDRLAQAALEVQSDTRELIGNLLALSRPPESLCSAISQAAARFEDQSGWTVSLEIADDLDAVCSSEALPPPAGVQLLRIVQEALANVRKHAGSPTQISVALKAEPGQIQLTVIDDGVGFDQAEGDDGKHFGLQVMRQRAARFGGQMSVQSAPGEGTRVEVLVPLAAGATSDEWV